MKIIAFNGSPRKKWNTAILLDKALKGAASQGAETEFINLYDYEYNGCNSCFACKLKSGKSYGKCSINDDLEPIFHKIEQADAIILGSPIYFGMTTGKMRSFQERLMFQYYVYDKHNISLFTKKILVGFIYTMNVNEKRMDEIGYTQVIKMMEMPMKMIFGETESLFVNDTYQFSDYSKYVSNVFNPKEKEKRRKEIFPSDCEKAFEMGVRFANNM